MSEISARAEALRTRRVSSGRDLLPVDPQAFKWGAAPAPSVLRSTSALPARGAPSPFMPAPTTQRAPRWSAPSSDEADAAAAELRLLVQLDAGGGGGGKTKPLEEGGKPAPRGAAGVDTPGDPFSSLMSGFFGR